MNKSVKIYDFEIIRIITRISSYVPVIMREFVTNNLLKIVDNAYSIKAAVTYIAHITTQYFKNAQLCATKLPSIACWLEQEQQADLIEMRQFWYADRSLNFWTHLSVGLKTQKYLIFDLFFFSTIQKVKDRFQPMKKDRLPKIKSSD